MRLREILPYAVLIAALAATTAAAWWTYARSQDEATLRFNRLVNRKVRELDASMRHYEDYLRGFGGLFAGSPEVTQKEWQAYTGALNLGQESNVLSAFAFSPVIDQAGLPAHLAAMRRVLPGYRLAPEPAPGRMRLAPVTLVQPLAGHAAVMVRPGADQMADPVRAEAMERALASRAAALTARMPGGTGRGDTAHSVMILPAYRDQAFLGFVHMVFRADALAAAVAHDDLGDLGLRLYDGRGAEPKPCSTATPRRGAARSSARPSRSTSPGAPGPWPSSPPRSWRRAPTTARRRRSWWSAGSARFCCSPWCGR